MVFFYVIVFFLALSHQSCQVLATIASSECGYRQKLVDLKAVSTLVDLLDCESFEVQYSALVTLSGTLVLEV